MRYVALLALLVACGDDSVMSAFDAGASPDGFDSEGSTQDAASADATFDSALADVASPRDSGSLLDGGPSSSARILFPPPSTYPSDVILVRGDSQSDVGELRLSGLVIERSDTGEWQIEVPLALGANVLRLEADGAVVDEVEVLRDEEERRGSGETPGRPLGIAWDASEEHVLLSDDYIDGLWSINVESGDRAPWSRGLGHEMVRPSTFVVDDGLAYVADGDVIVSVDLSSAEHRVVSGVPGRECPSCDPGGPPRGEGPLGSIRGMVIYEGRLLALMNGDEAGIVEVDRESGDRTLIHSHRQWENATSMAILGARLFITPVYSETLQVLNLETLERASLPELGGRRVLVAEGHVVTQRDGELFRVDEEAETLTRLSDDRVSDLTGTRGLAGGRHSILVVTHHPSWEEAPERAPRVHAIDPLFGTRVMLSAP